MPDDEQTALDLSRSVGRTRGASEAAHDASAGLARDIVYALSWISELEEGTLATLEALANQSEGLAQDCGKHATAVTEAAWAAKSARHAGNRRQAADELETLHDDAVQLVAKITAARERVPSIDLGLAG